MNNKLMILGASKAQCNAIRRGRDLGYTVVASDYNREAPGKDIADEAALASTFDVIKTIEAAKEKEITGIMTTGTDQPVFTVSKVAEELGLPRFLDSETAYRVTNKWAMKKIFIQEGIPTVPYAIIGTDFNKEDIEHIQPPYVLKPLDSQGQRGIYKLNSFDEIQQYIHKTLSYSRQTVALLEHFYPNDEVTISGWVHEGKTTILTITDRVTFEASTHIGICSSHEFPSKYYESYGEELESISESIVKAFNIKEGPIYFQMLIGDKGIRVNEIACRIGGAYEDQFIPVLTGIDILDMVIQFSMGKDVDYKPLKSYSLRENNKYLTSQLFFAVEGKVEKMVEREKMLQCKGMVNMEFNINQGSAISKRENATARAGYMIIRGNSENDIEENITRAYDSLYMLDENKNNLVIRGRRGYIHEG